MSREIVQYGLLVNAGTGEHELREFRPPEVLGPIDFALQMNRDRQRLCIGAGVLAGGIIPGSNRLIVAGPSPVWDGFYVSTVGGAALIWDGTGISFLALEGRASRPSVLILRGERGKYPQVRLVPVDLFEIWGRSGEGGGFYALQRHCFDDLWEGEGTPRVLAVGPAALATDFGAIGSSKTSKGKLTPVDCWAGRGGFGSRLLQHHNLCAIVYGGDFEDEDLTDRAEADGYFEKRFSKSMKLMDLEATTKYRFDPEWKSGGTFGVNYSKLTDLMLSFNYRSVRWPREQRHALWERLVRDHYLAQFNAETIETKQFSQCGEPCPAVCKKLRDEYKKDYEPYQAMGPLIGIFDQRAAERVNRRADALGFDGIQIGGLLAWAMECLADGLVAGRSLGLDAATPARPVFEPEGFDAVRDSATNAELALALLESCARPGHLLARGLREAARCLGPAARDRAVYLANGPRGWMVPNQYWVPGMFAPQAVMGKYYVDYKFDWRAPRVLGRSCAERMLVEMTTDNAGVCRFHRGWSEKLWSEIVNGHFGSALDFPAHHARAALAVHRQGRPEPWETMRLAEILHGYLQAVVQDAPDDAELQRWLERFGDDRATAARAFWDEIRAGIEERMAEIPDGD